MKGDRYKSVRSNTGRIWVEDNPTHSNLIKLNPIGEDVLPAQIDGKMQGGVRSIEVPAEHLADPKRWERLT